MPHRKLDRHLGTRGWILLVCAWVWGLIGLGILLQAAKMGEPSLLHLYMPVPLRVTLWWAPALLAIYGAIRRKHLPVVTAALIIAPLIRVASYLWAWITWVAHEVPALGWLAPDWAGVPSGWYSAAMHLPLIALVLIAAHSKEDTRDEVK
ncbi:hypothetical protein ACFYE2_00420 [Kocuria sp. CPCC 205300]|uniref:hypothetical protein n=1 Tax=Kocuria sabuli TaxID=3071448 RepID=UPI0036DA507F